MSNVSIERGFRVPLAEYRRFPRELQDRLPAAIAPYARFKVQELLSDLEGAGADGMIGSLAPRGYTPSIFARHLMKSEPTEQLAITLLSDWALFFTHPRQVWSSFDLTIRVDLWMARPDADGPDADYVYGRVVSSAADEVYIALLGIPGVEEFSYYDTDDMMPSWPAREPIWNTLVDEDSRTEWAFVPGPTWLHETVEKDS